MELLSASKPPLKILHVIARVNIGGTARYLDSAFKIASTEFDLLLATGHVAGAEVESPLLVKLPFVRIKHLGRQISFRKDYLAQKELKKLIAEYKPDLIQTHTFKAGLIVRTLKLHVPIIHTFHGTLFEDPEFGPVKRFIIEKIEKHLAKRTDLILTTGESVAQNLLKRGIGSTTSVRSFQVGIVPPDSHSKQEALLKLGLANTPRLRVGWMARVTGVKNPYLVLETAKKFPEIDFLIAGGGDLEEQIRSDAPHNCKILGWQNPSIFWSAVDIALSTSHNEGLPIALIEAGYLGKPLIGPNVGSMVELISNGETGFLVDGSVDSYVAALSKIINNAELLKDLSRTVRLYITKNFNLNKNNLMLFEIYQETLTKHRTKNSK